MRIRNVGKVPNGCFPGDHAMNRINVVAAFVAILGTFPAWSGAQEEKEGPEKERPEKVERERPENRDESSGQFRPEERSGRLQQLKQQAAEIERRIKQLASEGRNEEANKLVQQLRRMREQVGGGRSEAGSAQNTAIFPLELEEQMLLERYGSEHPKVKELRKRMEIIRTELAKEDAAQRERAEQNRSESREGDSQKESRAQHLRQAAESLAAAGLQDQAEQIRKQIDELYASENRSAGAQSAELRELQNVVRQLAERMERLETIVRRLSELQEQNQKEAAKP
jgi:hypothetical protein